MMGLKQSMRKKIRHNRIGIVIIFLLTWHFSGLNLFAQNRPAPVIDNISIENDHPKITWFADNAVTTLGYVIHKYDSPLWPLVDTVKGVNNTSFTDFNVNACDASQWYRVFTYYSDDPSQSYWTDTLETIDFEQPELDLCQNSISLHWTAYNDFIGGVEGYQILYKEGSAPFTELDTVPHQVTSYVHEDPADGVFYTYMIKAFNPDWSSTSSSCERTLLVETLPQPDSAYIRYVTVIDNDHIKLEWLADETAPISKFDILRSENISNYQKIASIWDTINFNPAKNYNDLTADFNKTSYYYKIKVYDSCRVGMVDSDNHARSILLQEPTAEGTDNVLSWNEYEGWDIDGVQGYNVYRKVDDGSFTSLLNKPLSPGTTTYTDKVADFIEALEVKFTYYIEATGGDIGAGSEESLSNEVTITRTSEVTIPNAFTPGQANNNKFTVGPDYIELDDFQLSIFNKWGQMIFQTTDRTNGWDGKSNGEYVPTDAYVYLVIYKTPEGQTVEERGTVTVLR
jgi:gliding motility-associated-like protein